VREPGHALFGFGMLFPIPWLIGDLIPPKETQAA
jgi:hypothetical protein